MKRLIDMGDFKIDLPKLTRTRMIIQAGSGGGKSYTLRRLLEQSHGQVQHIIIDPEGEFATLRERFDYVLAAKDGDTPADPRAAKLLAERLLTLKASAILDLYELKHAERIHFVRLFLDAMVNAPKHLWHPAIVVIDEAHIFCPQQDRSESESASAVIDLLTRGRKRGFCAILATQRLSKLHKDAAAECQNKLIGITSLDVDMRRAGDELGFNTREQRLAMRDLTPGEFFAFGPAITKSVRKVHVGDIFTTPPKAGARFSMHAPPPTTKIRKLLPSLADLPAEADQRELTQRELKQRISQQATTIKDLEKKLAAGQPKPEKPAPIFDNASRRGILSLCKRIEGTQPQKTIDALMKLAGQLSNLSISLDAATKAHAVKLSSANRAGVAVIDKDGRPAIETFTPVAVPTEVQAMLRGDNTERRMVAVLKQFPGCTRARLGALSGTSPKRSTFRLAMSRLRKGGLVAEHGDMIELTTLGKSAALDVPGVPSGQDAIDYYRAKIGAGATRDFFECLLKHRDSTLTAEKIQTETGLDPKISTFRLAVSTLRSMGLLEGNRDGFTLNKELTGA